MQARGIGGNKFSSFYQTISRGKFFKLVRFRLKKISEIQEKVKN